MSIKKKHLITIFSLLFSLLAIFIYSLLYTGLPIYIVKNYLYYSQAIEIKYANTSGYLLSKDGLDINNIKYNITKDNKVAIKKLNLKLMLSYEHRPELSFKIISPSINLNNHNKYTLNTINGNLAQNYYKIYYDHKLVLWRDKNNKSFKNHLEFKLSTRDLNKFDLIDNNYKLLIQDNYTFITINADFSHNIIKWNITAHGDALLNLTGYTNLKFYIPKDSYLNISSDKPILLINTVEAKIHATPDVNIRLYTQNNKANIDIDGVINIDSGIIIPMDYQAIKKSEDIVYIEDNNLTSSKSSNNLQNYNFSTKLKFIINNKLKFKSDSLKSDLSGELELTYHHDDSKSDITPLATGEINLNHAEYSLYGHALKIKQGILSYNNNPIDNPNIQILADRKVQLNNQSESISKNNINNTDIITINIYNTLNDPKIKLSSTTLLSEADQISYLLFGVSTRNISEAQGQIILQTAKSFFPESLDNNSSDTSKYKKITQHLKNILNIDELNLVKKDRYNEVTGNTEPQTTVVIGKELFGKLLLKYGFSLSQPLSIIEGRYKLTDKIDISAKYDQNNPDQHYNINDNSASIDIIYTNESDTIL